MKFHHTLALSGALCALLAASSTAMAQDAAMGASTTGHVDASGMPTDHSTPAEQAQTNALNQGVSNANAAADAAATSNSAQYQQQQQQYSNQLQQNQAVQQQYQDQTAAYESLRTHYADARAAYHRGVFPDRYSHWMVASDSHLVGQRVEITSGDRVGTVTDVAHLPNGQIEALRVSLDSDKVVWIDQADVRFDRAGGVVMTDLDRSDLRQMADERL